MNRSTCRASGTDRWRARENARFGASRINAGLFTANGPAPPSLCPCSSPDAHCRGQRRLRAHPRRFPGVAPPLSFPDASLCRYASLTGRWGARGAGVKSFALPTRPRTLKHWPVALIAGSVSHGCQIHSTAPMASHTGGRPSPARGGGLLDIPSPQRLRTRRARPPARTDGASWPLCVRRCID